MSDGRDNVTVLARRAARGGSRASSSDVAPRSWRARWLEPIDPPLAFATFLAGVLLVGAARAIEPPPASRHASTPLWLLAIDTVVWAGVCVGGIGLVKFWRVGLAGAALAAGALTVESAACVASGHHRFGVWWLGQIAATAAFGGVAAAAWRINERARARAVTPPQP